MQLAKIGGNKKADFANGNEWWQQKENHSNGRDWWR